EVQPRIFTIQIYPMRFKSDRRNAWRLGGPTYLSSVPSRIVFTMKVPYFLVATPSKTPGPPASTLQTYSPLSLGQVSRSDSASRSGLACDSDRGGEETTKRNSTFPSSMAIHLKSSSSISSSSKTQVSI